MSYNLVTFSGTLNEANGKLWSHKNVTHVFSRANLEITKILQIKKESRIAQS